MFGTLVVCLPSPHEGGDIRVLHGGEEKLFSTSPNSAFEMSCAAWYSDVLHEVRPVTAGYRVVLTYNLVISGVSHQPSADDIEDDYVLAKILEYYVNGIGHSGKLPTELIYRLGHRYSQASLKVDRLKRKDRIALERLRAAVGSSCAIYLALMEREVVGGIDEGRYGYHGGYGGWSEDDSDDDDEDDTRGHRHAKAEHRIEDVIEESTVLTHIMTIDGELVADELPASQDSFIQDIYRENRCPDKEDFEGYTGNEGASATHWYYDAVLVIVPQKAKHAFTLGPNLEKVELLPAIVDDLLEQMDSGDAQAREELADLVRVCLARMEDMNKLSAKSFYSYGSAYPFGGKPRGALAYACGVLQDPEIFRRATVFLSSDTSLDCFEKIGRRFDIMGAQSTACLDGLKAAFAKLLRPSEIFAALNAFRAGYYAAHPDSDSSLLDFFKASMDAVVDAFEGKLSVVVSSSESSSIPRLSHEDGFALVAVLAEYSRTDLEPRILKLTKQVAPASGAAIGLLSGLLKAFHDGKAGEPDQVHATVVSMYGDFVRYLDLKKAKWSVVHPPPSQSRPSLPATAPYMHMYRNQWPQNVNKRPDGMDKFNLAVAQPTAELYGQCLRTEGISEARLLDAVFINIEYGCHSTEFESFVVPLLQSLLEVLAENSLHYDSHGGRYQQFFQQVIQSYLRFHVGRAPSPPRDWVRERIGCYCGDCKWLNDFLIDGRQRSGRFAAVEKRRRHLSVQLSMAREKHEVHIEKRGSPYALVVTKNTRAYEQDLSEWHGRARQAEATFARISSDALRTMLDAQYFQGQNLAVAQLPFLQADAAAPRAPLNSIDANARGTKRSLHNEQSDSLAAKRRHVEVVDLT